MDQLQVVKGVAIEPGGSLVLKCLPDFEIGWDINQFAGYLNEYLLTLKTYLDSFSNGYGNSAELINVFTSAGKDCWFVKPKIVLADCRDIDQYVKAVLLEIITSYDYGDIIVQLDEELCHIKKIPNKFDLSTGQPFISTVFTTMELEYENQVDLEDDLHMEIDVSTKCYDTRALMLKYNIENIADVYETYYQDRFSREYRRRRKKFKVQDLIRCFNIYEMKELYQFVTIDEMLSYDFVFCERLGTMLIKIGGIPPFLEDFMLYLWSVENVPTRGPALREYSDVTPPTLYRQFNGKFFTNMKLTKDAMETTRSRADGSTDMLAKKIPLHLAFGIIDLRLIADFYSINVTDIFGKGNTYLECIGLFMPSRAVCGAHSEFYHSMGRFFRHIMFNLCGPDRSNDLLFKKFSNRIIVLFGKGPQRH